MILKIKIPQLNAGLVSNLIGLLGLSLIVLAIGGLTDNWWWAALASGMFAVGIAYMLGLQDDDEPPKG
jgi:hypothetical protein